MSRRRATKQSRSRALPNAAFLSFSKGNEQSVTMRVTPIVVVNRSGLAFGEAHRSGSPVTSGFEPGPFQSE
jgi:hypothetical protein